MKQNRLFRHITISLLFVNLVLQGTNPEMPAAAEKDDNTRCSSIPLDTAASILDVAMIDDLRQSSYDLMISPGDLQKKIYKTPPYNCTIRSTSNFLQSINYVTYVYNDPGLARIEFNRMREGFASVSKVDAVPNIGDEAFWVGDDRFQRMVALKGAALIDVLSPKDFNLQKQVICLVLDPL